MAIATGISDALRAGAQRARRADHPRPGRDHAPRCCARRACRNLHGTHRRRRPDPHVHRRPVAQPSGGAGARARGDDRSGGRRASVTSPKACWSAPAVLARARRAAAWRCRSPSRVRGARRQRLTPLEALEPLLAREPRGGSSVPAMALQSRLRVLRLAAAARAPSTSRRRARLGACWRTERDRTGLWRRARRHDGRSRRRRARAGGRVVGVIPEHLMRPEVAHQALDRAASSSTRCTRASARWRRAAMRSSCCPAVSAPSKRCSRW